MAKAQNESTNTSLSRPPVVVVLGHVDHGKTSLLDAIRKTDVASKEYGGITQSIGAYQVTLEADSSQQSAVRKITFIDTPGHEAFSNMRSRGANVADIAILVVAANDSVMPQTVESIKIIQEAKIPYVVAMSKVDLPEANVDKVISDLGRNGVSLENYGGEVPLVKVSAKKGEGIKELLDLIELLAEMNEIKGDPLVPLEAPVIESRQDKSRGPLATVIIKSGTLNVGDKVFISGKENKIRALTNYLGEQVKSSSPGDPVEILGLSQVPPVGATISSVKLLQEDFLQKGSGQANLNRSNQESAQSLSLILKADTLGSLEAIVDKIPANVNLLLSSVGEITEADVFLAKSTRAIILGFNVKVSPAASKLAETEKVLIRTYKIIYELLEELEDAAAGMLEPVETEEELGRGQVVAEFPYEKMRVAGTRVKDGRVARGDLVRVTRGTNEDGSENVVGKARIKTLRTGKEEVTKVEKSKECGILLDPQVDFQIGDDIISYRIT